ncbi:hypothetical protein SAMD00019534_050630 [Acytostelium subglobosum LB1]|uniref:hypothetical protein n=1 Tax=Acytostelium subglobosum LB1 TaxID=1410327 RepID=UPI0006451CAD|nr:hypothetical protein SAMD00019534_050630 [Acytostelium subglobosum LB1]GAM21888.1 hypothetical protein SAMD00019534_050630 [Acytostelium subglobosum LB1]|eukprot:XP_012754988.1 hypothetical protein SAMD00019534_050630 [Acytostelium subglobosum LB1]
MENQEPTSTEQPTTVDTPTPAPVEPTPAPVEPTPAPAESTPTPAPVEPTPAPEVVEAAPAPTVEAPVTTSTTTTTTTTTSDDQAASSSKSPATVTSTPASPSSTKKDKDISYDLTKVVGPRTYGASLKVAAFIAEGTFKRWFAGHILKKNGITAMLNYKINLPVTSYPAEPKYEGRTFQFKTYSPKEFLQDVEGIAKANADAPNASNTVAGFHRAYTQGTTDPLVVGKTFVSLQKASDENKPSLAAFVSVKEDNVLEQARQSQERWKQGKPKSILDGVPVSVKDEVDQQAYHTTAGTSFLSKITEVKTNDAYPVARLRELGALLVGKNNMHEIGISTLGYNLHFGHTRNPYNMDHYPGGSSSGSASSVSAGLNPISIGCDGGGSIRVPASLCGVVGLKATFSRVSHTGTYDLCFSVGHIGPIGATVVDCAIGYAAVAGKDDEDALTMIQPEVVIPVFQDIPQNKPLAGLKVGVFPDWCNDTTEDINVAYKKALAIMEEQGAVISEFKLEKLNYIRLAQVVLILSEMRTSMSKFMGKHRTDFHLDTRVSLSLMDDISSSDYLHCNKIRTYAINQVRQIFNSVDVIVTPMNAILAPKIIPGVLSTGESNLSDVAELMKFAFLGNITGVPGLSIPMGVDEKNLPIGLQIMGRWWEEDLLLYTGYVLERELKFKGKPEYYKPILDNQVQP